MNDKLQRLTDNITNIANAYINIRNIAASKNINTAGTISDILNRMNDELVKPEGIYELVLSSPTETANVREYENIAVSVLNLTPENIKSGVEIAGVVGTHEGGSDVYIGGEYNVESIVDPETGEQTMEIVQADGYENIDDFIIILDKINNTLTNNYNGG